MATDEGSAVPGENLRYTRVLRNISFVPLNSVGLLLRVPEGLAFNGRNDADPNASTCTTCTPNNEATWSYDSIPAGETRTIDINTTVSTNIQPGNIIPASIKVIADNLASEIPPPTRQPALHNNEREDEGRTTQYTQNRNEERFA